MATATLSSISSRGTQTITEPNRVISPKLVHVPSSSNPLPQPGGYGLPLQFKYSVAILESRVPFGLGFTKHAVQRLQIPTRSLSSPKSSLRHFCGSRTWPAKASVGQNSLVRVNQISWLKNVLARVNSDKFRVDSVNFTVLVIASHISY